MKRDLFAIDTEIEEALAETRRRAERVRTGRVYLELHRLAGTTVDFRVTEDRATEDDIRRLMQRPPHPRAGQETSRGRRR